MAFVTSLARNVFAFQSNFPHYNPCASDISAFLSISPQYNPYPCAKLKDFRQFNAWTRRPNRSLCFSSSGDRPPATPISATAKIRNEVLSPFRTVRMFLYLAFAASGTLGGLIALTRLIASLRNAANSEAVPEIIEGLGIDFAAVSLFAFLFITEQKAEKAQLAKLSREETLANLKLETREKKIVSVGELRGIARLVVLAGSIAFVEEAFRLSKPYAKDLLDRRVRVAYFIIDGSKPNFEGLDSASNDDEDDLVSQQRRLWQLTPVYTSEWSKWLEEQKSLANVAQDQPIYLSLRLDGRVRGSGVGYPPWNAFVAQLPPVKGMWSGVLDGMDGRVL
eukprot:TRINITY_DN6335_c0_g1_i1.p1 TRINITY_DN6335_c0_g1~~TRINITY_DN6335_c0_g1_i1.p1  ORF type:complete len:336 (+),score=60.23 TRINITY_DN6335_c0_g1_i1:89-1096(+)